jgi:murein DD-endopeptidase MepM/ murein hydrolase activator NlpD
MRLIRLFFLLLLLAFIAFGAFVYVRAGSISLQFFEKVSPIITADEKLGIGIETKNFVVSVSDAGAGLDETVVRLEQDGHSHDLLKERFPSNTSEHQLSLSINAKELGLKEGKADLLIGCFDRSFWVNAAQKVVPVTIKYSKPRGEILTGQQNIALGGVEPIFYKIKDSAIAQTGVEVGSNFFPGYKASLLDPRFERFPDVYFSFFSLPFNFNKSTDKVQLVITDVVGNRALLSFNYLVIPRKFNIVDMKLSDTFLQKVFDELLPPYFELSKTKQTKNSFDVTSMSESEKIESFKLINESYRKLLLEQLKIINAQSEPSRFWQGVWQRPMRAAPTSTFAETRNYKYNDSFASQSLHAGVDLADVANAIVKPAAKGKVLFADFFGIYGNAVIVDHGFGLTTLYGHLSSISVNVGEEVSADTTLGRSGATGLAGGDHLHYEVRLANIPVHPIEWWDGTWIREHIEKKIDSVFDQLSSTALLS